MKTSLIWFLFFLFCFTQSKSSAQSFANNYRFDWVNIYETKYQNTAYCEMEVDNDGNLITVFQFMDSLRIHEFDQSSYGNWLGSNSNGDKLLITKTDPSGSLIWTRVIEPISMGYLHFFGLTTDSKNNISICGETYGSFDFDPGPGTQVSAGGEVLFVCQLNANGELNWLNEIPITTNISLAQNYISTITSDDQGNIYIGGTITGVVNFDPLGLAAADSTYLDPLNNISTADAFLAKYNKDGLYQWSKLFGTYGSDLISKIDYGLNATISIGGYYTHEIQFHSIYLDTILAPPIISYSKNLFVANMDLNGEIIWVREINAGLSTIDAVKIDNEYNTFIGGSFEYGINFFYPYSLTQTNTHDWLYYQNPLTDVYFAKYNELGILKDAHVFGGYGDDVLTEFEVLPNNKLLIGANIMDSLFYDHSFEGATNNYGSGILLSLDENGGLESTYFMSQGHVTYQDVSLGRSSEIYVVGNFLDTTDLSPKQEGVYTYIPNKTDVFQLRWNNINALAPTGEILIYPNPASDQVNLIYNKLNDEMAITISLYSIDGKLCYQETTQEESISIPVHQYQDALYIVQVLEEEQKTIKKFVVTH